MKRAMSIAAHEPDGHEVEEATQVALDAVVGPPVLPRSVVDRQLGDAISAVVGQYREEAMELAVDPQVSRDLASVGLQAAVHVVQAEARHSPDDAVEDARGQSAGERIPPPGLPAGDEVEALIELREETWDLGWVVLEIRVDRDNDLAGGMPEAGGERHRLAQIGPTA